MESDKFYWHRYIDEYEQRCFSKLDQPNRIMEIGVLRGESIRYLSTRFPNTNIVGIDKNGINGEWPKSEKISYKILDQGERGEVRELFRTAQYDLVIDDGSHAPMHQAISLSEAIGQARFFIIEDLHTNLGVEKSPLYVLQAVENLISSGKDFSKIKVMTGEFFSEEELVKLVNTVKSVYIYRRGLLPLRCWMCKGDDFDLVKQLCCTCRQELFQSEDSIAGIVEFK